MFGDTSVNLQPKNTEAFRIKMENMTDNKMLYLARKNFGFGFSHSLGQVLTLPTRAIDQSAIVIDYMLSKSPDMVNPSGIITTFI